MNEQELKQKYPNYFDQYDFYVTPDMKKEMPVESIIVMYRKNATEGGNCYSDGGHYAISYDSEIVTEIEVIDTIIEECNPNISFFEYKKIMKQMKKHISKTEYIEYEYYGNETTYGVLSIQYEDIIKVLNDFDLI
jgi:hypothetical protein